MVAAARIRPSHEPPEDCGLPGLPRGPWIMLSVSAFPGQEPYPANLPMMWVKRERPDYWPSRADCRWAVARLAVAAGLCATEHGNPTRDGCAWVEPEIAAMLAAFGLAECARGYQDFPREGRLYRMRFTHHGRERWWPKYGRLPWRTNDFHTRFFDLDTDDGNAWWKMEQCIGAGPRGVARDTFRDYVGTGAPGDY